MNMIVKRRIKLPSCKSERKYKDFITEVLHYSIEDLRVVRVGTLPR